MKYDVTGTVPTPMSDPAHRPFEHHESTRHQYGKRPIVLGESDRRITITARSKAVADQVAMVFSGRNSHVSPLLVKPLLLNVEVNEVKES